MRESTISLCMIVKDEEEMLSRCLASVKDYVDELIVVDTGSEDGTVDIAKSFGARVYHHLWEDNFSKHRNQSIEYANGDWFLILDADEEIINGTGNLIRRAVRETGCDSITFEVLSRYAGGKESLHTQQRLFLNNGLIHYGGHIHNEIVGVKKTCIYPIKILHHGYNVNPERAKLKHERRLRILKCEINRDPNNPTLHHYLAASYLSEPDYEQGAREALFALDLADEKGDAGHVFYAWTHYIAASALYHLKRVDEAKNICRIGLDRFPDDPDLHFLSCQIAFDQKNRDLLDQHTARYFALHADLTNNSGSKKGMTHWVTFDQSWKIWWFLAISSAGDGNQKAFQKEMNSALEMSSSRSAVYQETGRYYLENGDFEKAKTELDRAFEMDQNNMDIIYSQIELSIHQTNEAGEIYWWKELLKRFPETQIKILQEARKALGGGRMSDARKLLEAYLFTKPKDNEALRLMAEYILEKGKDISDEVAYLKALSPLTLADQKMFTQLGFISLRDGHADAARDFFEKVLRLEPGLVSGHVGLAGAYWQQREVDQCVAELDHILRLIERPTQMEINALEQLGALFADVGEHLLTAGETAGARGAYEIALNMNYGLPEVYQGIARALQEAGQLNESLEYLKSGLVLSNDSTLILQQMGEVYTLLGNDRAAAYCYEKSKINKS